MDAINEKDLYWCVRKYRYMLEMTDDVVYDYAVETDTMSMPHHISVRVGLPPKVEKYFESEKYKECVFNDDQPDFERRFRKLRENGGETAFECRLLMNEKYIWYHIKLKGIEDNSGKLRWIIGTAHNIDAEVKLKKQAFEEKAQLEKLSAFDPLTGLYNRAAFKRIGQKMIDAMEDGECIVLTYTDINNFAYINDHFGYKKGDMVLKQFASMIRSDTEAAGRISSRIYSDYFVAISRRPSRESAVSVVSEINDNFCEYMNSIYPDTEFSLATGVYFIGGKKENITTAIDKANMARRKAKSTPGGGLCVYCPELGEKRHREQMAIREFHSAIESGSIEMFLQPKFSIKERKVVGAEALARWRDNDGTYRMPTDFIDVLERVGYIVRLDHFMFEQALKTLSRWRAENKNLYPISVNFSRLDLREKDFVKKICSLAEKYPEEKKYIEIEVTESAFAEDKLTDTLTEVKKQGFRINLDDFGIGYSSLGFLYEAPIDVVKVDRSFIYDIENVRKFGYIKEVCHLITSSESEVIFEGIETEKQAELLYDIGVRNGQGWLFNKAISVDEFERTYLQ